MDMIGSDMIVQWRRSMRRALVAGCILILAACQGVSDEAAQSPTPIPPRPNFATSLGVTMILVPGGKFHMGGGSSGDYSLPVHQVTLSAFYVAKAQVTVGQFARFVTETGNGRAALDDALKRQLAFSKDDDLTMLFVTWNDATAFCEWVSKKEGRAFHLTTEAQWEYVARAGYDGYAERWWENRIIGAVGDWSSYYRNWPEMAPERLTLTAGMYPANPWGIYWSCDRVWTPDLPGSYTADPQVDPTGPVASIYRARTARGTTLSARDTIPIDQPSAGIRLVAPAIAADHAVPAADPPLAEPPPVAVRALPSMTVPLGADVAIEMLRCPAATITMGRAKEWNPNSTEWPATAVTITSDYWLGKTVITQKQFDAVLGRNPSTMPGANLPVQSVIMSDIVAFCAELNRRERAAGRLPEDEVYRLPTEAEWEQAARAGSDARFICGDDPAALRWYAWYDITDGPHPVATKRPNAWGFYDMVGNILQITGELHDVYHGRPESDPYHHTGGTYHWFTARGSAWNMDAVACQTTLRRGMSMMSRCPFVGFRLARGKSLPAWAWGSFDYSGSAKSGTAKP